MTIEDYNFNSLENNVFYIKKEFKKKSKEYGILKLNKNQINILVESLDLMEVSPLISPAFSQKLEKFITPRFLEINEIIYTDKPFLDKIGIEFTKENQKEIIKAFELPNVISRLKEKGYSSEEFINLLRGINFSKYKS